MIPEGGEYSELLAAARAAADALAQGVDVPAESLASHRAAVDRALAARPADIDILFAAFQFRFRSGDLDGAEEAVRRRISLVPPGSAAHARALTNLGLIQFKRGRLDEAEPLLRQAVEIDRNTGDAAGLARDLGNLSLVPEARGGPDLARAEALLNEAIEAAQPLPAEQREPLVASFRSNLGDIAWARGQFAAARALWIESAAVHERLGIRKWQREFAERLARLGPPDRAG